MGSPCQLPQDQTSCECLIGHSLIEFPPTQPPNHPTTIPRTPHSSRYTQRCLTCAHPPTWPAGGHAGHWQAPGHRHRVESAVAAQRCLPGGDQGQAHELQVGLGRLRGQQLLGAGQHRWVWMLCTSTTLHRAGARVARSHMLQAPTCTAVSSRAPLQQAGMQHVCISSCSCPLAPHAAKPHLRTYQMQACIQGAGIMHVRRQPLVPLITSHHSTSKHQPHPQPSHH